MHEARIPTPREQEIPGAANLLKAALLAAALLGSFYATDRVARALDGSFLAKWAFVYASAAWDGVLLTGMGILAHEAVHRVLTRRSFWNELVGGWLAALTLVPFYANRQYHLTHHAHAHQPGLDPENEMHDRPFALAVSVGSLFGLRGHYRNYLQNLTRLGDPLCRQRARRDTASLAVAGAFYFLLLPRLGIDLLYTFVPMALTLPAMFAWRALSDHYGVPPIDRSAARSVVVEVDPSTWEAERERRQREITGWVVLTAPWLEWLWSHVNYHEVHHKYPWLSHAHLPAAYAATVGKDPYLVVRGYWRAFFLVARRRYYETPERVRPFLRDAAG